MIRGTPWENVAIAASAAGVNATWRTCSPPVAPSDISTGSTGVGSSTVFVDVA